MPTARSALMVGRGTADLTRAVLEMIVLVVCGLLVGWQWPPRGPRPPWPAVGLILLLRLALTWVGIFLGSIVPPTRTRSA